MQLRGEHLELVTNNSKGTEASNAISRADVMRLGFNAVEVKKPIQEVKVGKEKR